MSKGEMARVFYESWQLDCCGDEFSRGDEVTLLVQKAEAEDKLDYYENHHGPLSLGEAFEIKSVVSEIKYDYKNQNNDQHKVGGVDRADKFRKHDGDNVFYGYIVYIQEPTISSVTEERLQKVWP